MATMMDGIAPEIKIYVVIKKKKIASLFQWEWRGGKEERERRVKEERIQYTFHLAAVEHYLKYNTF